MPLLYQYDFSRKNQKNISNLFLKFKNETAYLFFVSKKKKVLATAEPYREDHFRRETEYYILFKFSKMISIRKYFKEFEEMSDFFKTRAPKNIHMIYGPFAFTPNPSQIISQVLPGISFPSQDEINLQKYDFSNKRETKVSNLFIEFENEKSYLFFVSKKQETLSTLRIYLEYNFFYEKKYFVLIKFIQKISIRKHFKEFKETCIFFKTKATRQILDRYDRFLIGKNSDPEKFLFVPRPYYSPKNEMNLRKYDFSNKREIKVSTLFLKFENEKNYLFFETKKKEIFSTLKIHLEYTFYYETNYFILMKFSEKISIREYFKGFEKICTFFKPKAPREILDCYGNFLLRQNSSPVVTSLVSLSRTPLSPKSQMNPFFFTRPRTLKQLLFCFETKESSMDFLTKSKKIFYPENLYPSHSTYAFEIDQFFFVLLIWKRSIYFSPNLKPKIKAKFFTVPFLKRFLKTYCSQCVTN